TNAQSRALEDALRRIGIPYIIVGGVAFYKRKEIKDVLAYLRVVVNPLDEESLLRIINYPTRSIGDTTVAKLKSFAREHKTSLLDALASPLLVEILPEKAINSVRRFHA
ncbi:MAG: pcrA, partial [Bacteroidetes bacterium]|nr:pcrA [Bacteroidota bacterium]